MAAFFNFKVMVTESKFRVLHSDFPICNNSYGSYLGSYLGSVLYCKYNPALGLAESCEREISLKFSARMDLICFLMEFSKLRLFS